MLLNYHEEHISLLLNNLQSCHSDVQLMACTYLSRWAIGHPEIVNHELGGAIRKTLEEIVMVAGEDLSSMRREAIFALGFWGNEESVEILVGLSVGETKSSDENLRQTCMFALGVIGGLGAIKTLCQGAEKDETESVRLNAIGGIVHSRFIAKHSWNVESKELVELTLRKISDNLNEKGYLRRIAGNLLKELRVGGEKGS